MDHHKPLISVVIPVYNKVQYLDRCLESVVKQDYDNTQIILIDDGSSDGSEHLCDSWAEKDSRIQVMHKKNAGLGMARNSGLELAQGKYISFVDADDSISLDYLSQLYAAISLNNADIAFCGFTKVERNGTTTLLEAPDKTLYSGKAEIAQLICDVIAHPPTTSGQGFTGQSQCTALYDREFYISNNLRNLSEHEIISEDVFFNISALKCAKTVVIVPTYPYYYYYTDNSLTSGYRKDRFEAVIVFREKLLELLKDDIEEFPELAQRIDRNFMDFLIHCIRNEVVYYKANGKDKCMQKINSAISHPVTKHILKYYPINLLPIKQRILFEAVKNGNTAICFLLFKLRYNSLIVN